MKNSLDLSIIIDRSGSVENEAYPIEENLKLLIESFRRKYNQDISLNLNITVVGEEDFTFPTVSKNVIFNKLNSTESDIIKVIKTLVKDNKEKIILYSDGYFVDESNILELDTLNTKMIDLICIGIGEGYNRQLLKELSSKNKVLEYKDIYNVI